MEKNTTLNDLWAAFRKQKSPATGSVLEEYQKKGLDSALDTGYTGVEDGSSTIEKEKPKVVETPKKPIVTAEQIVATKDDGTYKPGIMQLARTLRDMQLQYSLHSSEFMKVLFSVQDDLGLNGADLEKITGQIIKQKQAINDSVQNAINGVFKH